MRQVVGCPDLEPMPKTKGPGPPPVYHDVIRVTLTPSPNSLIGLVNRVAESMQSMPLIDKVKTKHRFVHFDFILVNAINVVTHKKDICGLVHAVSFNR